MTLIQLTRSSRTQGGREFLLGPLLFVLLLGTLAPRSEAQDGSPRVLRTMVHHQITLDPRGMNGSLMPVVSDNGNKVVFALNPATEGSPIRLAAVDFDGGPITVLDGDEGLIMADLSADGSRVVYVAKQEIRTIGADGIGRNTLLRIESGAVSSLRISGNGRTIAFHCDRDFVANYRGQSDSYVRGVYRFDYDGDNFRRVAGPEEVARLRGVQPNEPGNPNFTLEYRAGSMDISSDGQRVVFGCWVRSSSCLFGCDINGRGLRTVSELQNAPGQGNQFTALALSGDATTVAVYISQPYEIAVVAFSGGPVRSILKAGPEDGRFGWRSSEPIYVTLDGSLITHTGRLFKADGSGFYLLMTTHQDGLLRYFDYEHATPDAYGRRFAYWPYEPSPIQLATMELNVPFERLRGAPKVTNILVDPPVIPRELKDSEFFRSRVSANVAADPSTLRVSSTVFYKSLVDPGVMQFGRVAQTDQVDDGREQDSGDATAADRVYTRRWLAAYGDAPEGPRTLRIEAQVIAPDQHRAGVVVELGPYFVVPGSKDAPAGGTTPVIEGTPPEPPPINPQPGDPTGTETGTGTGTGPGTGTGDGTGPGTGSGTGSDTGTGAIDLTGYWTSESGALHFIRQIGTSVYWSMDFLPRVRNVLTGTISGDVITAAWVDLPGGELETGTGALTLKIESNDRLTKISDSPAYDASVWTRVAAPVGAGGGPEGIGTGPGGGGSDPGLLPISDPPTPSATPAIFKTEKGRALIDQWTVYAMTKINAHDGTKEFNVRKPYSINQYGLLSGTRLHSVSAPEGFKERDFDRYWFMWDYWIPGPGGWRYPEWNAAGVTPLRDFVVSGLAAK